MDKIFAEQLSDKTKRDYNSISHQFSSSRNFFWKDLDFLIEAKEGDAILDLGCGNGRLLGVLQGRLKNFNYCGIDNSEGLISEAKKKYPNANFSAADAKKLPFRNNFFDKVFAIALLHHIPSKDLRLEVLEETKRILKPGGTAIFTVWNLVENKRAETKIVKTFFLKIFGLTKLDFGDIFVPWKDSDRKILVQRYIHVFNKKELENLFLFAGFKVKKIGVSARQENKDNNIYLIAENKLP